MAPLPPHIGKYRVERRLGEGGMGTVYLAHDEGIDRLVAIKLLRTDHEDMRKRFRAEAQAVGKLKHPNIVTVYDYTDWEGSPCIVMEYVEGHTLSALIRERTHLTDDRRLQLMEQVARGLAYAHRASIVHRDIKPSNLMLDGDGAMKIVDFGIARSSGATNRGMTGTGNLVGTLAYMSPEQIRGEQVDRRCDIFSLGLVLYEFMSGKTAFTGDSDFTLINRIVASPPEPFRHPDRLVCELIQPVLDKALAKSREQRYQDADQFAADLVQVRRRITNVRDESTVVLKPLHPTPPPSPAPPGAPDAVAQSNREPNAAIPEVTAKRNVPWLIGAPAVAVAGILAAVLYNPAPAEIQPPGPASTTSIVTAPSAASPAPTTVPATTVPSSIPSTTTIVVPADPPKPAKAAPPTTSAVDRAEVSARLSEAKRRFEDGEYEAAIASYQAALKIDPKNSEATAGIAETQKAKAKEEALLKGVKKPGGLR